MNCSTSRSSHYNTHLYHPYSRNAPFIGQNGQESVDASSLKSFNQQLGINCSVTPLNASLPTVSSNSYSGLLATVSKPNGAYHSYQFDNGQFGHLGHLSSHLNGQLSNLSHNLSNSLSAPTDSSNPERAANDLSSLANQYHSNYSSQLEQFNQLNQSSQLNHLAENTPSDHHSNGNYPSNQTSVIVCNAKVPTASISTPSTMISDSPVTSLPGAFPGDANRSLENDDEIELVMAYISSSQDEQRKIYSNQNSGNHTELAAHQISKENQLIHNQVRSF